MNRTQDHRAGDGADYRGADYRGAGAEVRPARAADLPALGDFFTGLSAQSRYLRFFSPITPGPPLLTLLCGGHGTTDVTPRTWAPAIRARISAEPTPWPCQASATTMPKSVIRTPLGPVPAASG